MVIRIVRESHRSGKSALLSGVFFFLLLAVASPALFADEPYARSKDYDLQHSKIVLHFDVEHHKVIGDVTHSVAILRDGTSQVAFDSVGLTIHHVTLNKARAKFDTTADKLIVHLPGAARAGEKFEIEIQYDGKPAKGLYFILPDKSAPDRPIQIWTQGESGGHALLSADVRLSERPVDHGNDSYGSRFVDYLSQRQADKRDGGKG